MRGVVGSLQQSLQLRIGRAMFLSGPKSIGLCIFESITQFTKIVSKDAPKHLECGEKDTGLSSSSLRILIHRHQALFRLLQPPYALCIFRANSRNEVAETLVCGSFKL